MKDIELVYIDLGSDLVMQSLVSEALGDNLSDIKQKSLVKLGITKKDNESCSDAWLRHLSEINGFVFTKLVHPELANAIGDNRKVLAFFFWLI